MKTLVILLLAAAIIFFAWEPLGEWKTRVAERRASFNEVANALYNEGQYNGNSVDYLKLSQGLISQSREFISLLNTKPYGLPLTTFENELLENAKNSKKDEENYLVNEEKALDPNNPNHRLSYVEAVQGRASTPTPTPTPTPASTPSSGFPFPPGVDTPEQRRAYLQEWAIERRNKDNFRTNNKAIP